MVQQLPRISDGGEEKKQWDGPFVLDLTVDVRSSDQVVDDVSDMESRHSSDESLDEKASSSAVSSSAAGGRYVFDEDTIWQRQALSFDISKQFEETLYEHQQDIYRAFIEKLNERYPVLGDEIQMLAEFQMFDEEQEYVDGEERKENDFITLSLKITAPMSHEDCPLQEEIQDCLEEVLMMCI